MPVSRLRLSSSRYTLLLNMKVVLVSVTAFSPFGFYSTHFSRAGHYICQPGDVTALFVVLKTDVSLKMNTGTSTPISGTFIYFSSNRTSPPIWRSLPPLSSVLIIYTMYLYCVAKSHYCNLLMTQRKQYIISCSFLVYSAQSLPTALCQPPYQPNVCLFLCQSSWKQPVSFLWFVHRLYAHHIPCKKTIVTCYR